MHSTEYITFQILPIVTNYKVIYIDYSKIHYKNMIIIKLTFNNGLQKDGKLYLFHIIFVERHEYLSKHHFFDTTLDLCTSRQTIHLFVRIICLCFYKNSLGWNIVVFKILVKCLLNAYFK